MDSLIEMYNNILSIGDKRVENWPLMQTPVTTILILISYAFTIWLIKFVMSKRNAFDLRLLLILYNAFQVCVSLYITVEIVTVAVQSKYSLVCETVNYSTDPLPLRMASAMWLYYIIKIVDLLDTVLFALRKKQNQITFLHVFHHSSMVANAWYGVKFVAGGQTFLLCFLNSFVHVVMYTYYGLSAMGPSVQKYLWWKKYITQMQLIQFFAVMFHSIVNIFADCSFPKAFSMSYLVYGMIITGFFANFYIQSYINRIRSTTPTKKTTTTGITNGSIDKKVK